MAYIDKYGVEFSDDRKTLVKCPKDFNGEYIIPHGITSVDENAFRNCSSLTSVTIPDSITSIGIGAFFSCHSLASIEVANDNPNYSSLDGVLFDKQQTVLIQCPCDKQGAYTIPNSVTSIEEGAFSECRRLTSVTIPNSVTSIEVGAFINCCSLTSVKIPKSVTSIGFGAFFSCHSLTSIEVAKDDPNYSSIDGVLFNKQQTVLIQCPCGRQGAYTIPNGVTSIDDSAFSECSQLTSVTIPNSVTSIEECAFDKCRGLTSVTIPKSVTSIGMRAFYSCRCLTSVTLKSSAIVSKNYVSSRDLTFEDGYGIKDIFGKSVTEFIIGHEITSIGSGAFKDCSSLTSLTIPNSVTSIENWAFSGCKVTSINFIGTMENWCNKAWSPSQISSQYQLLLNGVLQDNVKMPNSVTNIGDWAFSMCSSLTSVTIGNSITNIGRRAFYSCSSLASVTILNSVTSIRDDAFSNCCSLTSVMIGNSVTSIGKNAFNGCGSLTSVTIPNSVTSIEESTFEKCCSLTSVTIPKSVTSIGMGAFFSCSSLTSVTIPNGVTSIGYKAFYGCNSLTSVTIPNSVIIIGMDAFRDCSSLPVIDNLRYADTYLVETVDKTHSCYTIKDGTKWIGSNAFQDCRSLTSVTIPNSVTKIGWSAFCGCSSLASVTIPNSVTRIEEYAFANCSSLTYVKIPNSVIFIGLHAFRDCRSLTSVTISNSAINMEGVFFGCNNLAEIYVPQGQKERFAQMEGLEDLKHLIVEKADVALNERFTMRKLLYNNGVTCFYHFTSRKNIDSICQHGGLYSCHYLKAHQIDIPLQGGGELSQELDRYKGVADYVHLSFCENHPMAYHLIQEGEDIVVLKISTDVALLDGTMFTDMNAVDSLCNCGVGLEGLQKVNFAATKEKYLSKDDSLFKYKQAEILVKTHVPLEYILNIDEFI